MVGVAVDKKCTDSACRLPATSMVKPSPPSTTVPGSMVNVEPAAIMISSSNTTFPDQTVSVVIDEELAAVSGTNSVSTSKATIEFAGNTPRRMNSSFTPLHIKPKASSILNLFIFKSTNLDYLLVNLAIPHYLNL